MTKRCPHCEGALSLDKFYLSKSGRVSSWCKGCQIERSRRRILDRPEQTKEYNRAYYARNKSKWDGKSRELRARVLDAYGGHCACCGEATPEFLAVDHVNNDGESHRRELKGYGRSINRWLSMQGFPQDGRFQLLCHNCNMAKGAYGGCPHKGPVPGSRQKTKEWVS